MGKDQKYVIIGGVATGPKVAARLRRLRPDAEITIIEQNEYISYGGCGFPLYIGGTVRELKDLMTTASGAVRNVEFFLQEKNITVLTGTVAEAIDRTGKEVIISKKTDDLTKHRWRLPYDKLVLATGAEPFMPAIPGINLPGVVTLHKPQDALALQQKLSEGVKNIVIIGGGLIGLEAAEALAHPQKNITIVERERSLVSSMLDEEMSLLVKDRLELNMVDVILGESVVEITTGGVTAEQQQYQVKTTNTLLEAQLVIFACGVKPNSKLAGECGLEIGEIGGILVDEYLTTSDPDIYAGGDCVENTHRITKKTVHMPLASIANKQGRVIANNLAGSREKFPGVLGTSALQIFELNIGKTGLTEAQAILNGFNPVVSLSSGLDATHYHPGHAKGTIKLIADDQTNKIIGAQAIGEGDVIKRLDVIATIIALGGTVEDLHNLDLCYAPVYATAIDMVIHSANVLDNVIKGYVKPLFSTELVKLLEQKGDRLVLLDVRTAKEARANPLEIPNVLAIPLSELRARIEEIPKEKEIVTICPLGIRAYEAATILQGSGFAGVTILAGGLRAAPEDLI